MAFAILVAAVVLAVLGVPPSTLLGMLLFGGGSVGAIAIYRNHEPTRTSVKSVRPV